MKRRKQRREYYIAKAYTAQFADKNHQKQLRKVENAPTVYSDGGGKKQGDEAPKWYQDLKKTRIDYLNKHFSKRKKNRPWYMLTAGKCWNYEERETSWGTETKKWKVPSETATLNNKFVVTKAPEQLLIEHKMSRWEKRHPKPCEDNDLFKEEFLSKWEYERKAFEYAVRKQLEPLIIKGRFKQKGDSFVEIPLRTMKDTRKMNVEFSCEKPSKIKSQLSKIVDLYKKDDSFVAGKVYKGEELVLCIPALKNAA